MASFLKSPWRLFLEARIRQNELGNPKFNFLSPGDPYHAYYRHKVNEFREGKEAGQNLVPGLKQLSVTTAAQQKQQELLKQVAEQQFIPFITSIGSLSPFSSNPTLFRSKLKTKTFINSQDFSRNGTFVNGELIGNNKCRILQNDDVIALSHPNCQAFVLKDSNLKQKYAGPQVVSSTSGGAQSVAELEKAIAEQGDKVRALKQSKADKSVWQPVVNILLDLKKKLEAAQATPAPVTSFVTGSASAADLEKAIAAQGDKVRALKQSKADKSVVQPEVNILLDLKKQLAAAQAAPASSPAKSASPASGSLSLIDLEKAIAAQGDKVRALKQSIADKSVWQPEVNILLDFKKQLAAAQAQAPAIPVAEAIPSAANDESKIKELEDKIAKQGEKVRQLKSSSDASVWKPEVEVLLGLKKELSAITGVSESPSSGKNKKIRDPTNWFPSSR